MRDDFSSSPPPPGMYRPDGAPVGIEQQNRHTIRCAHANTAIHFIGDQRIAFPLSISQISCVGHHGRMNLPKRYLHSRIAGASSEAMVLPAEALVEDFASIDPVRSKLKTRCQDKVTSSSAG